MKTRKDWQILAAVVVASVVVGLIVSVAFLPEFQTAFTAAWSAGSYSSAVGVFFAHVGSLSLVQWGEVAAVVTGIVAVYFATREVIWVWPVGIVWCLLSVWVYFESRYFGDMALMLVYFVLQIHGWRSWKHGGSDKAELPIRRAVVRVLLLVAVLVAVGIVPAQQFLQLDWVHGKAPFWDAFTTSGSLGAQFLLNRKYIENWVAWIIVDIVYVPLYFSTGLYAFSFLYAVFLVLAVVGLVQWLKSCRQTATSQ